MKIETYCLNKNLSEEDICKYSLFKLGEVSILDEYAQAMAKLIKEKVTLGNCFIYTANKSPVTIYCKKCSVLLAEKVAQILELPIAIAEYVYSYDQKTFYDNQIERKQIHKPHLNAEDKKKFMNKKAIIIDDSKVTGLTLQVAIEDICSISNQACAFVLIDLVNALKTEQEINNYFEKKDKISLIKIINMPGYVFTSHMMRIIDKLGGSEKTTILKEISPEKFVNFKRAYSAYFDKEFDYIEDKP